MTAQAVPVPGDPPVTDLVLRARHGDRQAWDALVERYCAVVWSICRRHRLSRAEAGDVCQSVWLRAVDELAVMPDPAALPGWLAVTTRGECRRVLRAADGPQARVRPGAEGLADQRGGRAEQELAAADRRAALRAAFGRLPPGCRRLIAMLIEDPPVPYPEITARLGIPAGSIGTARRRCLQTLRHDPVLAALISAGAGSPGAPRPGQAR